MKKIISKNEQRRRFEQSSRDKKPKPDNVSLQYLTNGIGRNGFNSP